MQQAQAVAKADIFSFLEETTQVLLSAIPAVPGQSLEAITYELQANSLYLSAISSLASPLPTDGTPYSRHVLYSGPLGEAMIAHWPAGAHCRPHDHGFSAGMVTILSGVFFEQNYSFDSALRKNEAESRYQKGDLLPVQPGEIHSMRSETGGITLHLYRPAISEMKVYDEHHATIYTVANDCGAWVPQSESLILHRASFGRHSLHH